MVPPSQLWNLPKVINRTIITRLASFQPISSPRPRSATPEKLRMSAPRLGLGSASEVEASYTLEGGYGTEALPDGTGAWLAHRAQADVPGSGPGGRHWKVGEAYPRKIQGWQILPGFCGLKIRTSLGTWWMTPKSMCQVFAAYLKSSKREPSHSLLPCHLLPKGLDDDDCQLNRGLYAIPTLTITADCCRQRLGLRGVQGSGGQAGHKSGGSSSFQSPGCQVDAPTQDFGALWLLGQVSNCWHSQCHKMA